MEFRCPYCDYTPFGWFPEQCRRRRACPVGKSPRSHVGGASAEEFHGPGVSIEVAVPRDHRHLGQQKELGCTRGRSFTTGRGVHRVMLDKPGHAKRGGTNNDETGSC
jgi:hypothetical protein